MSSYAIDVTNSRVKEIMEELGIEENELLNKTLEDFADARVTSEVQQLRFEYYSKKLKETVKRIRDVLKDRTMTIIKQNSLPDLPQTYNSVSLSTERVTPRLQDIAKAEEERLNKLKEMQKQKLINTLAWLEKVDEAEKSFTSPKSASSPRLSPGPSTTKSLKYKAKIESFKKIQQEKFKEKRKEQAEKQKNLYNKIIMDMKFHSEREKLIEQQKKEIAKEKDEALKRKQEEIKAIKEGEEILNEHIIQEQLDSLQSRIMKSEEKYATERQNKLSKTLGLRKFWDHVLGNLDRLKQTHEVEDVLKLIAKQEKVKKRREQIRQKLEEEVNIRREKMEKRKNAAHTKVANDEKELYKKVHYLEKRLTTSQKNLESKQEEWKKEVMLRKELQRLKELDGVTKVERANRRLKAKKLQMLEKQLMTSQRIDALKSEREMVLSKKREAATKEMIQREKMKEIFAIVCRSPKSKTAQEQLRMLDILKKPSSEGEEES
ncbi:unnamed protein product [Blepharisma stoltei]|uniref:Uncharacterized protein n=1 Tax=Blepharisma stoltei TaxID=1481888 RepID=A0AAU9JEE2_9CILI|nr:unnamed protein product [Blepharisma stoltei]